MCAPRKIAAGWRRARVPGDRGTGDSRENRPVEAYPKPVTAAAPEGAIEKTRVAPADSCAACRSMRRDLWPGGLGISEPEGLRCFEGEQACRTFPGLQPPTIKLEISSKYQTSNHR